MRHNIVHFPGDPGALHHRRQLSTILQRLTVRILTAPLQTQKPEETKPNQAEGSHHGVQLQARHMPWRVSTENKIFIDKRAVHHDSETHTNNNHG